MQDKKSAIERTENPPFLGGFAFLQNQPDQQTAIDSGFHRLWQQPT